MQLQTNESTSVPVCLLSQMDLKRVSNIEINDQFESNVHSFGKLKPTYVGTYNRHQASGLLVSAH